MPSASRKNRKNVGCPQFPPGRLDGRADGARLTARFSEDNGASGEILMTLGRENRTFAGQWRRTDIADDYWHGFEGWRLVEEEAAPQGLGGAAPAEESAGEASAWAGVWDTSIGDMVLRALTGGVVKGGYDGTFGRIEARAGKDRLEGRFYEDNGNWGEFVFVLEPGGKAFKGRWRRLNLEADNWHDCEGSKVDR